MTAVVIRGDARALPLPDESVDLVCTSPPYWALRAYQDNGETYEGQIGSEATPAAYIAALLACTREWVRVLKPSGSLFVNLGDKYAGSDGTKGGTSASTLAGAANGRPRDMRSGNFDGGGFRAGGAPAKSLVGLPWRYALGCIDQLGLTLRAEIIWKKVNGLPESVTDRVRRSHETWFHLTRGPRYFAAVDEIREPHTATVTGRHTTGWQPGPSGNREIGRGKFGDALPSFALSPLGKLPGSVWDIPSEPLTVPDHLGVDHFAAFPTEWPKRIVLGWSPSGVCTACGEGRRPTSSKEAFGRTEDPAAWSETVAYHDRGQGGISKTPFRRGVVTTISGYACACAEPTAPTRPSVIVDPFGGTGTVALVASTLGRIGISIDRSADYCRLAAWRTSDAAQRAKVLGVPKPPTEITGQGDLFADLEASA